MRTLRSMKVRVVLSLLAATALISLVMTSLLFWPSRYQPSQAEAVFAVGGTIHCSAFTADRKRVFVVTADGLIYEIVIADGSIRSTIKSPANDINSCGILFDESGLLLSFATGGVGILDRATKQLRRLNASEWIVCLSRTNSKPTYCASRLSDGKVFAIDDDDIRPIFAVSQSRLIPFEDPSVDTAEISPSGEYLAISLYSAILLLSTVEARELWIDHQCTAPFAFSNDSKLLATYRHDKSISLIKVPTTVSTTVGLPTRANVTRMSFSEDGKRLYCATVRRAGSRFTILGVEVESGQVVQSIEHQGREIVNLSCSNGSLILIDRDGRILKYAIN